MKLLTFGLLKAHSGRFRLWICKRPTYWNNSRSSFTTQLKTSDTFAYQYDLNELLENVNVSSKRILVNASNEFRLEEILKSDYQYRSITSSVILAGKHGLLNNSIDEITDHHFLNHISASILEMTFEDVVSTLIALNLLNVPLHHPINQKLTIRVMNMLKGEYKT